MILRVPKAHVRLAPTWLAMGVVFAAVTGGWPASARAADAVIPSGHEADIVGLVAPFRLGGEVAEGFHLDGIQIGQRRIDFVLATKNQPAERVTVVLTLRPSTGSLLGSGSPYELSVDPPGERSSPSARRVAATLQEVVGRNADGAFWDRLLTIPQVGGIPSLPWVAPSPRTFRLVIGAALVVLGLMLVRWGPTRVLLPVWRRWAAPIAVIATAVGLPVVVWLLTRSGADGGGDPGASWRYRQMVQRDFARFSLWVALATGAAAALSAVARGVTGNARARLATAGAVTVDALGVLAWSAVVRFVLTEPNVLTDGGSGYGRLWRLSVGGWQGLSVLIEALFPEEPRFMWTIIRVPWVLAALAPALLLLLARALGFGRARALFAGIALASLPLHAAMYSSDFEFGPLLSFNLLGLALVAAAVRFERAELAAAGSAVLAYTCWGRPDAPIVGAAFAAIVAPALPRWRTQPVLVVALGWFAINAVASFAGARALGVGSRIEPHLWLGFPVRPFLRMQQIVPFWLLLPLPLGVAQLLRRDPQRLVIVGVGVVAGLLPLSFSPVGGEDPTRSYMEYFRYGTWALPWILLLAAEGTDAGVGFVTRRFARLGPDRSRRLALAAQAVVIAVYMATPLFYRSYLARQYGPRVEERAFREALRHVPDECGLVVPDDESDDQGGGTIEILRRYVYIAEEAAAEDESHVNPERVIGVTDFLRAATDHGGMPPAAGTARANQGKPLCWYYFRGSYCYTGLEGHGSAVCASLERHAALEPTLTQRILYVSHRMVTRPDLTDRPLYDPDQALVLSRIVEWRADVAAAEPSH